MKKLIFLIIFLSACGGSEVTEEPTTTTTSPKETTTSSSTTSTIKETTTKYLVQNPILDEESIKPLLPFAERFSSFECPDAPLPKKELFLVNLSSIPDENLIQCYNYALSKTIPTGIETLLIIYPVGDYVGELQNNDTRYRPCARYKRLDQRQYIKSFQMFPVHIYKGKACRFFS